MIKEKKSVVCDSVLVSAIISGLAETIHTHTHTSKYWVDVIRTKNRENERRNERVK